MIALRNKCNIVQFKGSCCEAITPLALPRDAHGGRTETVTTTDKQVTYTGSILAKTLLFYVRSHFESFVIALLVVLILLRFI